MLGYPAAGFAGMGIFVLAVIVALWTHKRIVKAYHDGSTGNVVLVGVGILSLVGLALLAHFLTGGIIPDALQQGGCS